MKTSSSTLRAIGTLIKNLREERALSQTELAEKIGTTQSSIARLETGDQNVSTTMLQKIGAALERDVVRLADGAMNIRIDGGKTLKGTVTVKTSKNAAVVLLCASLMNRGATTFHAVPRIEEVYRLIEVMESMGVSVRWKNDSLTILPPKEINLQNLDISAATKTRSIILFIGPLLHHLKKFSLPQAGGCKLGSRTVQPHFFALQKLGVKIKATKDCYEVSHNGLRPSEIVLYESGDTVTENAIMAAAFAGGTTTIRYASANYMGQDLCHFLMELGVKIDGIGTTTLTIHALASLPNKPISYSISEDPIDAMFFITVAIVTKSSLTIKRAPIRFLELELLKLEKMGFKCKLSKIYKGRNAHVELVDITTTPSALVALNEKIHPSVYPGLNIDNLPFFVVIATQAKGQTLIHDWVYEKRAIHFKDMDKLGADTVLADPHRLFVNGPTPLRAAEVICPPALRPGAIILIGMLAATGQSTLRNMYSINRGYEDIIQRLNNLGAKITILHEF